MNFTLEQLIERQQSLGGSDLAAALGLSPWKTPYELYVEKTTDDPLSLRKEMTPYQEWGHRLEEAVAKKYQDDTRYSLLKGEFAAYNHRDFPWLTATPDFLVMSETGDLVKGLEIKTVDAFCRDKWGASGTAWDGNDINLCPIPYHYYLQVAHYMMVVNVQEWDLAVLIGGNDYRVYHFLRNLNLEALILHEARTFWADHVMARKEPTPDFIAESVQELIAKIHRPEEKIEITFDEAWSKKVHEARQISEDAALITKQAKALKAELRHFMGHASIAYLQGGGALCVKTAKDGSNRMTFKL